MQTSFFVRPLVCGLIVLFSIFISCDDEISEVGSGVLTGTEIVIIDSTYTDILTAQIPTRATRTNNLNYNLLGHFKGNGDNAYEASYNLALQPAGLSTVLLDDESFVVNPDDDTDTTSITRISYVLDAVTLVLPYRYSLEEIDTDAETEEYNIESEIFGDPSGSIAINVYESGVSLQSTDVQDAGNTQAYYANGTLNTGATLDFMNSENRLLNQTGGAFTLSLSSVPDSFSFENTEEATERDEEDMLPEDEDILDGTLSDDERGREFEAIRIELNEGFREKINSLIINDDGEVDLNLLNDVNNIRDLEAFYIQVDPTNSTGVIEILEFGETNVDAGVEMTFTKTTVETKDFDDDETTLETNTYTEKEYATFLVNTASGRALNLIDSNSDTNSNEESETILLQSGSGSVGLVKLFDDFVDLNDLVADNVLVNDAELILTLNRESQFYDAANFPVVLAEGDEVPDSSDDDDDTTEVDYSNVMITQITSGSTLQDFATNLTSEDADPTTSLQKTHLVPLQELDGEWVYRINITEYVASLLDRDALSIEDGDTVDDIDTEELIAKEALQLIISPTNDVTATNISRVIYDFADETNDDLKTNENIFVNQGAVLSFETIPIYSAQTTDENKAPRLILKYTSTN